MTTITATTTDIARSAPSKAAEGPERGGFRAVWWRHLLTWVALVWALFPIVYIVAAAFNPAGTLSTSSLLPTAFSTINFHTLLTSSTWPYFSWYRNSLYVSIIGSVATIFIGACAAYVFSRMRFRGRRAGLMALLLLQMFPALLAFVAVYSMFNQIGQVLPAIGLNTTNGLILAYLGGAMGANVWLLKGYFDTVPRDLDEAARIDGASHARTFFTIVLPLVRPILVTVFMLSFVGLFSEFMLASIFLRDVHQQTLGVGLWALSVADKNAYFGQFCAGALLASLPVVAIYLGLQKQLIGGLTGGSVK